MSHSSKPEETHYPDDIQLKNEIDEISSRINRIMETVKVHFPMSRCGRTESEPDETIEDTRD